MLIYDHPMYSHIITSKEKYKYRYAVLAGDLRAFDKTGDLKHYTQVKC